MTNQVTTTAEPQRRDTAPVRGERISNERMMRALVEVEASLPVDGYMTTDSESASLFITRRVESVLPPGSRVLDFGSGLGDKAAVMSALGYDMAACDDLADEWHLRGNMRERILNLMRRWGVDFFVCEENKPLPWPEGSFDMVMSHHVLEHLVDSPRDLMLMLTRLVRDGGYIYVSVPSAVNIRKRLSVLMGKTNHPPFDYYYWTQGPWRGHRREYCRDDLQQLAACLGLKVVQLNSYHYMNYKLPRPLRSVYNAVTTVVPGWRDSWYLIAQRPQGWNPPQVQLRPLVRKVRPEQPA